MIRSVTARRHRPRCVVRLFVPAGAILAVLVGAATSLAQCSSSWATQMGNPGLTSAGRAYAFATLANGDVVVGGSFTSAGGLAVNNVARFNPTTGVWTSLGAGVGGGGGTVFALAVVPSGVSGAGDLIVGGNFTSAGGIAGRPGIARYNPTTNTWSALGSGLATNVVGAFATVNSIVVLPSGVSGAGDVFVGGTFTSAGGVAASNVARLNLTTNAWTALPNSVGGTVNALAAIPVGATGAGDIVIGGSFTSAGGVGGRNNIARFTPSSNSWQTLGVGANGPVTALAALPIGVTNGGEIVVGGDFATIGGVSASRVARLTPATNTFSTLGTGVSAGVNDGLNALAVAPGGDVVAAGGFLNAGTATNCYGVARYNFATGSWAGVGGAGPVSSDGVAYAATTLANGDIIIGGSIFNISAFPASGVARWSLNPGPVITTQPASTATCVGNSATFSVVAQPNGNGALSYQWRRNGLNISGANGASLTISNAQAANVGNYDCVLTSGCTATTNLARLDVSSSASFLVQPIPSIQTCVGDTVIVDVVMASAGAPYTYQWRKGTTPINTATNPSAATRLLSLSNFQASDAGLYNCVVTNACGTLTSSNANVFVAAPSNITRQPSALTTCSGSTATFSLSLSTSSSSTTFSWRRNGSPINPATTPSAATQVLSLSNVQAADNGTYDCVVGNGCSGVFVTSNGAALTVTPGASITSQPTAVSTCPGTQATFTIVANNANSYRWRKGTTAINTALNPSAATATLVLNNVQATDVGSYDCVVTNTSCGGSTSSVATLTLLDPSDLACAGCACVADFDASGGTPDAGDVDAFFIAWLAGEPTADADCSGGTPDAGDVDVFFQQWLAGGC